MTSRVDIPVLNIQGASPGPKMLIIAGVHGDEFEPMAAVRRLYRTIDRAALCGGVSLAPCVNMSAFNCNARAGDDGLDLARVCPGAAKGSTTVRTAFALAELIRAHDYLIDLHTGGMLLRLFPLAGYMLHRDERILNTQRTMARAMGLPLVWGTSPELDGRTLSVARDANIPAIYAEFGGGGGYDENAVDAYVSGCMNVQRALKMYQPAADAGRFDSAAPVLIEDGRDRAGFLQVQHPSPVDGFFEPACNPGDRVRTGDQIGRVVDALGKTSARIAAKESGLVVMLRTWRHVHAGDALVALASDGGE